MADKQGKFVLVVDDSNTVKKRNVLLGRRINAMGVVEEGLKVNEQVIIEGLQKVRAGITVKPIVKTVNALTGTIAERLVEQVSDEALSSAVEQ